MRRPLPAALSRRGAGQPDERRERTHCRPSLTAPHACFVGFFSSLRIGGPERPEVGSAKSKSGPPGSPIPFYGQLYFLSAAHPCHAAAPQQQPRYSGATMRRRTRTRAKNLSPSASAPQAWLSESWEAEPLEAAPAREFPGVHVAALCFVINESISNSFWKKQNF
jgi:hypothetical protein